MYYYSIIQILSKNCPILSQYHPNVLKNKVHTVSGYYPKQCIYTAWILYWYFPNIVQKLSKYYPNIIKTSSRYCPNIVKTLCLTLAIYCPNIVWIRPGCSPNVVQILSKYCQNIILILSRYCSKIVKYWPKRWLYIVQILYEYCPDIVQILFK